LSNVAISFLSFFATLYAKILCVNKALMTAQLSESWPNKLLKNCDVIHRKLMQHYDDVRGLSICKIIFTWTYTFKKLNSKWLLTLILKVRLNAWNSRKN